MLSNYDLRDAAKSQLSDVSSGTQIFHLSFVCQRQALIPALTLV